MRNEFFSACDLFIRESGGGVASRTIGGYAIVFGVPSVPLYEDEAEEVREVIDAGAVTRELLDASDIKMTMFHDRQSILARSKNGAGTLRYDIDERGVSFEFDAPNTVDGDKALELVRRGDISGCSFAFTTDYNDRNMVSRETWHQDGRTYTTFTVRSITGVYDFTLAADPAYEQTGCAVREQYERDKRAMELRRIREENIRRQVAEMRLRAKMNIF